VNTPGYSLTPKIGNRIQSHFRILFDHKQQRLYFSPAERPDELKQSVLKHGIILWPTEDFLGWQVVYRERSFLGDSEDLLAQGSLVKTVNDLQPGEVFEDFCDWFLRVHYLLNQTELALVLEDNQKVLLTSEKSNN
jgi:hypothetical protein